MTQANLQAINDLEWRVLSLRLTIFVTEGPNFDPTQLWVEAVGDEPEEEQNRPRSGEFTRVGQVGGMRLRLLLQPGRVDLLVDVNAENPLESAEPITLSATPWGPARELIDRVANVLLGDVTVAANRLAFGAILVQAVEDARSGYQALDILLDTVAIDPDGSSDFAYQINRRRKSKVMPTLAINRLSKWGVIGQGTMRLRLSMAPEGHVSTSHMTTDIIEHAVRLEIDINTVLEEPNVLPKDHLISLFEELVNLGVEIAEQGDIL